MCAAWCEVRPQQGLTLLAVGSAAGRGGVWQPGETRSHPNLTPSKHPTDSFEISAWGRGGGRWPLRLEKGRQQGMEAALGQALLKTFMYLFVLSLVPKTLVIAQNRPVLQPEGPHLSQLNPIAFVSRKKEAKTLWEDWGGGCGSARRE